MRGVKLVSLSRRRRVALGGIALLFAALALALGVMTPSMRRYLAIDGCLDRGGSWDYEQDVCRGLDQ
jgi:hypothetical protein